MTRYDELREQLRQSPRVWLVTGAAGFIGSNLVEALLHLGQEVVGLDNFSTGHRHNLVDVRRSVGEEAWLRFRFMEGDIRDLDTCVSVCSGVDLVLHQAALGSVPRSIDRPLETHQSNIDGFFNMLVAARDAGVPRFVYAASSSTYGDHPGVLRVEKEIGSPLSPYAVTKYVNELYASVFQRNYGMEAVGLRYFNVFGPRQDPNGAYAAVIPRWIENLLHGRKCVINGDGETTRDFCYVENVVQANILAACSVRKPQVGEVYNVAVGERTTLNQLFLLIRERVAEINHDVDAAVVEYAPFRPGDIRHSLADITKAEEHLDYRPTHTVEEGLAEAVRWFARFQDSSAVPRS